jgi:DNA-binding Xre family transcriptional regulator
MQADYTPQLRQLMYSTGLPNFQSLYKAGLSKQQIKDLRQGNIDRLRLSSLQKIAQVLNISLEDLLQQFSPAFGFAVPQGIASSKPNSHLLEIQALKQEYQRLADQLAQQQQTLQQAFQAESLQILESWLIQWPKAAHAARHNPQLPAVKLLPLIRPIEELLQRWQIESIGEVGAEVTYDSQLHLLLTGTAAPATPVRVEYVGYRQGDRLLHRAKVSLITPST